jgi:hypothetical protein
MVVLLAGDGRSLFQVAALKNVLAVEQNSALPVRIDLIHRNATVPDRYTLTKPAIS